MSAILQYIIRQSGHWCINFIKWLATLPWVISCCFRDLFVNLQVDWSNQACGLNEVGGHMLTGAGSWNWNYYSWIWSVKVIYKLVIGYGPLVYSCVQCSMLCCCTWQGHRHRHWVLLCISMVVVDEEGMEVPSQPMTLQFEGHVDSRELQFPQEARRIW